MQSILNLPPRFNEPEIIFFLGAGVLIVLLMWVVHRGVDYCCLRHAWRYSRRNGVQVIRSRWRPECEASGIKTEFTLIELDCLDDRKQRKIVRLLVWVFGVRKVLSHENYPEALDATWPRRET